MPPYQDLIEDVIGYWTPEDRDQLVGTVLQVGWDRDDMLAADIQPREDSPEGKASPGKASQGRAPLRVRIGDKFWKDWSEAGPSQGGPSRGDKVRITFRETPLMEPGADANFESEIFEGEPFESKAPESGASEAEKPEEKTSARYVVEVIVEEDG